MKMDAEKLMEMAQAIHKEMGLEDDAKALEGVAAWASATAEQEYGSTEEIEAEIRSLAAEDLEAREVYHA